MAPRSGSESRILTEATRAHRRLNEISLQAREEIAAAVEVLIDAGAAVEAGVLAAIILAARQWRS
jgi:hypothetical protein